MRPRVALDIAESSAPQAHPSTEEHDDTVETQYSGLERLRHQACDDGWVTIGQLVVDSQTGEESEECALYLCRKCVEHTAWA
jgi:hypothetical protein